MQTKKTYTNIKIEKRPHSMIEIEGEITKEEMGRARKIALKQMGEEAALPGFRKGHVPENILIEKLGEMHILEEAAEIALGSAYPDIVIENDLSPIDRPEISITKIAKDNPLGFKIKVPVFPEVTLPDYKSISKKEMATEAETLLVKDEEVETVVKQLRENKAGAGKKIGKEGVEKTIPLPEVNDEFVKSFGDFKNVEDFKEKIKGNLLEEKKVRAKEKKRLAIGEKISKEAKIDLPETLIEGEIRKMHLQFEEDLKKMGVKIDEYMKHLGKKEEEMKKEWRTPAEDRVKLQIILNKIALEEKIKASHEEIEKEASHILEHHKDAAKEKVTSYVEMMLTNEKVWEFLELQK